MSREEYINNENWVDMREGAAGTVLCILESVGFGAPGSLVVRFPDWSNIAIECDQPRLVKPIPLATAVRVRVIRTEDGLKATMIRRADGSGVPIPLVA